MRKIKKKKQLPNWPKKLQFARYSEIHPQTVKYRASSSKFDNFFLLGNCSKIIRLVIYVYVFFKNFVNKKVRHNFYLL